MSFGSDASRGINKGTKWEVCIFALSVIGSIFYLLTIHVPVSYCVNAWKKRFHKKGKSALDNK